jgi:hypothetical protein
MNNKEQYRTNTHTHTHIHIHTHTIAQVCLHKHAHSITHKQFLNIVGKECKYIFLVFSCVRDDDVSIKESKLFVMWHALIIHRRIKSLL